MPGGIATAKAPGGKPPGMKAGAAERGGGPPRPLRGEGDWREAAAPPAVGLKLFALGLSLNSLALGFRLDFLGAEADDVDDAGDAGAPSGTDSAGELWPLAAAAGGPAAESDGRWAAGEGAGGKGDGPGAVAARPLGSVIEDDAREVVA